LSPWSAKKVAPSAHNKIHLAFPVESHKADFYERMVPEEFSTGADDRLMWSLIMQYSLEGNTDGQPNGHFYLTQDGMKKVSDEVVATHLGFKDEKKEKWVKEAMA